MRERVHERWADIDEVFRPGAKALREAHVAAVQNIAAQLFAYPTTEYPHFRTFVNEPEVEQKVFTNYGVELAPDIVVLEWPERLPRIIAEVLTPDMLTDDSARDVWLVESRIRGARLYLYAPSGHAATVKKLLKKHGIKDVGLRTWRNIAGMKAVDVAEVR